MNLFMEEISDTEYLSIPGTEKESIFNVSGEKIRFFPKSSGILEKILVTDFSIIGFCSEDSCATVNIHVKAVLI
jgi:hypothetical protein